MTVSRWGPLTALVCAAVAFDGCGKSNPGMDAVPDCAMLRACGSSSPAPAAEIPPSHRSSAQACGVTSPAAMPVWTYTATGQPCASDDQCPSDGGLRGRCLGGACTSDECLTDDDCPGGGVCVCSAPVGNSAVVNHNTCVRGNCRVDGDCGANGYCVPSPGLCGVDGFFCHTQADTCVDPTKDCGASCESACHYFPDKGAFACLAFVCGGC